jgi:hypothetical protein
MTRPIDLIPRPVLTDFTDWFWPHDLEYRFDDLPLLPGVEMRAYGDAVIHYDNTGAWMIGGILLDMQDRHAVRQRLDAEQLFSVIHRMIRDALQLNEADRIQTEVNEALGPVDANAEHRLSGSQLGVGRAA